MGEVDVQEKALLALKHLHAAGLVDDAEGGAEAPEGGGAAGACRGGSLPAAVQAVVERCVRVTAAAAAHRMSSGPHGAALGVDEDLPTVEQCSELAPLARQLEVQLATNRATPRTLVSDTIFHLEL